MKKFTCLILLIAAFAAPDLAAQQAVTSSGGEASGSGGSASYSTGQVSYTTITGTGGTATQGVQQPYEIFVLGNDDFKSISLNITAFPNPTISTLTLRIEFTSMPDLRYQLFDLNGRLLRDESVKDMETLISMETLEDAVYILKVYSGRFELKTFKIIKNKP